MTGWGGGIDYLCQMIGTFSYIDSNFDDISIDMHLLLREGFETSNLSDGAAILCNNVRKISDKISIHNLDIGDDWKAFISEIDPDFCLPVQSGCYRLFPTAYVSYIGDFQSEYLTDFFSAYEMYRRRKTFRYIVTHAPYVIATSRTVYRDIEKFYPNYTSRIFVQSFAPLSNPAYWDTNDSDIEKYHVSDRYFIISSQFWKHKNHITAFKAISELKKKGIKDVQLVCTGKMGDYRDSNYQRELLDYIEENDLTNNISLLGYIPKEDQLELMKKSVAVIQPTLFEGDPGGCSVYEAVGFGKRVIMSSIEVNLEAKGTRGVSFFSPHDYIELANRMQSVLNSKWNDYSVEIAKEIYEKNSCKAAIFYKNMMYEIAGKGHV